MPAHITHTFLAVAAACFPLPGCSATGYFFARLTRYTLTVYPPAGLACPDAYRATAATPYEALAAVVQLFQASAHAYPATAAYAGTTL